MPPLAEGSALEQRDQLTGVRGCGLLDNEVAGPDFENEAVLHHRDPVAHVADG